MLMPSISPIKINFYTVRRLHTYLNFKWIIFTSVHDNPFIETENH